MLSRRDSGNDDKNQVVHLARIIGANPWVKLSSIIGVNPKHGRSVVEREILKLVESIGVDRHFSLIEVINLLTAVLREPTNIQRLLVAPADILEYVPCGQQVRAIPSYIEEILKKAQYEVLLLAPFWDMPTLTDLLRCMPRERENVNLVLLLVHMGRRLPRTESMANEIHSVCPLSRVRIYLHIPDQGERTDYPHAKCLVVDRSHGYLGSANFTGQGMKGHFEVGVSLLPQDCRTLSIILQHLWTQSGIFSLAWDGTLTTQDNEESLVQ
ncbi:MAG: phospholipase D-like domain-containing protein [Promethearchaeati archaeon]